MLAETRLREVSVRPMPKRSWQSRPGGARARCSRCVPRRLSSNATWQAHRTDDDLDVGPGRKGWLMTRRRCSLSSICSTRERPRMRRPHKSSWWCLDRRRGRGKRPCPCRGQKQTRCARRWPALTSRCGSGAGRTRTTGASPSAVSCSSASRLLIRCLQANPSTSREASRLSLARCS